MTPEILDVRSRDLDAAGCLVTVAGDIDHDTADQIRDVLDDALTRGRNQIVLDLTGIPFCDSGGLSLFVDTHRRCAAGGGWFRLAAPRTQVLQVLHATNLDEYLTVRATVDEALKPGD